ncbi:hypothetical protein ACSBR2_037159 [Camellia fascicularis]
MAVSQSKVSLIAIMAVVVTIFSLIEGSLAAEAPAPSPVAAAGAVSPSLAVGCIATFAAFIFGSALKI